MREILFRGKRTDNGEWIYGDLVNTNELYTGKRRVEIWIPLPEGEADPNKVEYGVVDPATVGQFTGLTDKNGKRIFEGDALKIKKSMSGFGLMEIQPIVFARWEVCGWILATLERSNYYRVFPHEMWEYSREVIGNIHDNPELLQ